MCTLKNLFVISILTIASFLFVGCSSNTSSDEIEVAQASFSVVDTEESTEITEETTFSTTTTYDTSSKMYINENVELTKEAADALVVRLIKEYYTSLEPVSVSPDTYIVDFGATIRNERVKSHISDYVSSSNSPAYYKAMSEYGTYYSVTGLTEKETVLFEMDNNRFAISEPYSDITDYSVKYPYLFTMRNSDSTTAYYWCAQQETDLISYASHRVVRIWLYNSEWNTYSCIFEKE